MTDIATLRELLTEVAKLSEDVEHLLEGEDYDFEIQLRSGQSIGLEYEAFTGRVMFSVEVGVPRYDRLLEIYETLLLYNALWRSHGGARAAITARDEPVILMYDVFIFGLDAAQIADILQNFSKKATVWEAFVTARAVAGANPLEAETMSIRV